MAYTGGLASFRNLTAVVGNDQRFTSSKRLPSRHHHIVQVVNAAGLELGYTLLPDLHCADDVAVVADDEGKIQEEKLCSR